MSRTLAEARCRKAGHLLARLQISDEGHRVIVIMRLAVWDFATGKPLMSNKHGGEVVDLDGDDFTRGDSRHASCACGSDFHLHPDELVGASAPRRVDVVGGVRIVGDPEMPDRPPVLILDPDTPKSGFRR